MSGFSVEWLALREPADTAARSADLAAFISRRFEGALLDLGGGTGANVRYLSTRLPSPQHWTVVDDDPALLARVPAPVTRHRARLQTVVDEGALFDGCSLVTASALLDLVSDEWLAKLVLRCRAAGAAVLFALSYDGRIACSPEEPDDEEVRRLVNDHQKTDKGFGPALGPAAGARAAQLLAAAGYTVKQAPSDWKLLPAAGEMQKALVNGWAAAASDMAPSRRNAIENWRARRLGHIDAGRSRIVVGHTDVAGVVVSPQSPVASRA
jgi:hypothetical protein